MSSTERQAEIPRVAVFGVFDGHGGHQVAEYISMQLFIRVLRSQHFPHDMKAGARR